MSTRLWTDFRSRNPTPGWRVTLAAVVVFCCVSALANDCPENCLCYKTREGPTVRCNHQHFERVPEVPSSTVVLDLRFNRISTIHRSDLRGLRNLTKLFISNNEISQIEAGAFTELTQLKYLYLSYNRLSTAPLDVFAGLTSLQQLYLHYNSIESISPGGFNNLISLERLYVYHNRLRTIPREAFAHLTSLKGLRLDSNPLICGCDTLWLSELLKRTPQTKSAATCAAPDRLRGTGLARLSPEDVNCYPPRFITSPTSVDVFASEEEVRFECKASGDPPPTLTWRKDGAILSRAGRHVVLGDGILTIAHPSQSDEGIYECVAENEAGQVVSQAALTFYEEAVAPTLVVFPKSKVETIQGNGLTMKCRALGVPRPVITWLRGSRPLRQSPRVRVSPAGDLEIASTRGADRGTYRCSASNRAGHAEAATKLYVKGPPRIITRPVDTEVLDGHTASLACRAEGYPSPAIAWTKDGNRLPSQHRHIILPSGTLRIVHARPSDQGQYECQAVNVVSARLERAFLTVRPRVPPTIVESPSDVIILAGRTAHIPCVSRGAPHPVNVWIKDNVRITEANRFSVSSSGTLTIRDVGKADEGMYECAARNSIGVAFAKMSLTVQVSPSGDGVKNEVVNSSIDEAINSVDRALNSSIAKLFTSSQPRKPSDLLALFRFPSPAAQQIARAAEIFERAIELVHEHVEQMKTVNVSNKRYSFFNLLSPAHVNMIANLSGCSAHRRIDNCSDICFHRAYRTHDGTCNNLQHPMWGASLTPFRRLLSPVYENGFNTPIGWTEPDAVPNARLVSRRLVSASSVSDDAQYTHMLMQWGQFLDHDLDFTVSSLSTSRFSDGLDCTDTCENQSPCFPIGIPPGDARITRHRCMQFTRSSAVCGTGTTSVFFSGVTPREQMNQITAFLDASNVYGSSDHESRTLRDLQSRGLMKTSAGVGGGKPLLPFNRDTPIECLQSDDSPIPCFLAGDFRANEQLGLLSMHTLWMREHNRVASELGRLNAHWDGDKIYHETRKIVGASMQHISYTEWLPKILGPHGMRLLGNYHGYEPSVDASIINAFATAAFRFGHGLINPIIFRLNASFEPIAEGNIPLHQAFFSPYKIVNEGGIDPILRGLIGRAAKSRNNQRELLNNELTEHLFGMAHAVALDLAALNIQRGRDHALPGYNAWRGLCNLSSAESFDDFQAEISDAEVLRKLQELYKSPADVDLWVGGLLEDVLPASRLGKVFTCIIAEQFRRIRAGDRFWYENPPVFQPEQLVQIKQVSLARVLCDNGDAIDRVQPDVFLRAVYPTGYASCATIPRMDLRLWKDCCEGNCPVSDRSFTISKNARARRFRRAEDETDEAWGETHGKEEEQSREDAGSIPVQTPESSTGTGPHSESNGGVEVARTDSAGADLSSRVTALESTVTQLKSTINTLTAQLNNLLREVRPVLHPKGQCITSRGETVKEGTTWRADGCITCTCQPGSEVLCTPVSCTEVQCDSPDAEDNECCARCLG